MDNLNLIDRIYELEAGCDALIAEARRRAAEIEAQAKREAAAALRSAEESVRAERKQALAAQAAQSEEGARTGDSALDEATRALLARAQRRRAGIAELLLEKVLA